MREERLVGLDAIEAVTQLLQRNRATHSTAGAFEAAEIQWWWRTPSSTDELPQLVWSDDVGPVATAFLRDWGDGGSAVYTEVTLTLLHVADLSGEAVGEVVERGLAHAHEHGIPTVEVEVEQTERTVIDLLLDRGFVRKDDGVTSGWLAASDRPAVSLLPDGYELFSRDQTRQSDLPHHLAARNGPATEARLLRTSLYRPDLDLIVLDERGDAAAYGLFWFDPTTATGVVEPMRTNEAHRRRGLARHVLTSGIDRLAEAGAERISIGWGPANPASGPLYRSVGFEPSSSTDLFAGPTTR